MLQRIRKNRTKIIAALACAFVFTALLGMSAFGGNCDRVRDSVLRLHIIANSDTEDDQALKLKVRDALLALSADYFKGCKTRGDSENAAQAHLADLKAEAQRVIKENGYGYNVNVSVGEAFFGTRRYGEFTLPAGNYDALRVVIGEGRGHNWWCVMFPPVCLPAATGAEIGDVLNDRDTEIVEHETKYKARFKCVELYEKAKRYLWG